MTTLPTDAAPDLDAAPKPRRTIRWGQLLVLVGLLALLALVAFQMSRIGPLAAGQVGAGEAAPAFTLQPFDGPPVTLADLRGQVVVVNFWASWCKPCEQEAAALQATAVKYADRGVVFLGVAYVDTEPESRAYLDRFDITYANGPDLGTDISHRYRVKGVPETFIVDQAGTVRELFVGPTTGDKLSAVIDQLLAE